MKISIDELYILISINSLDNKPTVYSKAFTSKEEAEKTNLVLGNKMLIQRIFVKDE